MSIDPGPRPELTWLPVDRLSIDESYQRSVDSARGQRIIKKIAANFRWSAFQAILASPAGANQWLIIDGQHRVMAARLAAIPLVPAVVIHGLDRSEQAQAFVRANGDRTPVSAQALFYARLAAGDETAQKLQRICAQADIELLRYPCSAAKLPAGKTAAVPALLQLLKEFTKPGEAEAAIAAVAARWRDYPALLCGSVFLAAARFLNRGRGDRAALDQWLSRLDTRVVQQTMQATPGGQSNRADAILFMRGTTPAPAPAARQSAPPPPTTSAVPPEARAGIRFADDPKARRDPGSTSPISREAVFGRSATGSTLA